jgi:23S rRNA (adenine2503-C2)-methyltransferase
MQKPHLLGLLPGEFSSIFRERFSEPVYCEPAYRAGQILAQFYALRGAAWDGLTSVPKRLRPALAEAFSLDLPAVVLKRASADGTRKYLFGLEDGVRVESVLIPEEGRFTVCFSTQAGCALGCAFCATGQGGFKRNLRAHEMTGQVMAIEKEAAVRVTNCVAMGQGEPLLNLDETARAVAVLNDERCFGISSRRLTVSTAGIAPAIRELADRKLPARLAVSLHTARQATRERLMPVAKKYPLPELRDALRHYADKTKNRITFEYILLSGVNDTAADARALAEYANGLPVYVNLIPWNPVAGIAFVSPSADRVKAFVAVLGERGIEACVRKEKGGDIEAACGQLTQKSINV